MSVLDELIPIAVHMMSQKIQGTWNFTNPGTIEHNQILEMYKEIVDQNFCWKNFSQSEQDAILLSKRSNNHLDTTKLTIYWELYKHEIRDMFSHAEFSEIKDAVKKTLKEYSIYKNI